MAKGREETEGGGKKIIALNRKARFQYHIVEKFEAGIVLLGSEIKSLRQGHITINESYVRPQGDELVLVNAHIKEYPFSRHEAPDPLRPRKLLMHKSEIHKLRARVETKGFTIVPLSVYLVRGRAKMEIALARGKDAPDKRETVKEREAQREMSRYVKG